MVLLILCFFSLHLECWFRGVEGKIACFVVGRFGGRWFSGGQGYMGEGKEILW